MKKQMNPTSFKQLIFWVIVILGGTVCAQEPLEQNGGSQPGVRRFSESKPFAPRKSTVSRKPAASRLSAAKLDDGDTIRIDSTLVTIPVTISDPISGRYVSDLQKPDFKIYEDGVEQEIEYFGVSDKPLTVLLLIDTSPSTNYEIEEIQEAAATFVKHLKPDDRVEVIKFNKKIRVLTRATKKRSKIFKAIEKARFDSGTSLYDAVEFSLQERLGKIKGRKAIVLFTDGVDTTSKKAFYDDTVEKAEKSDSIIFPIFYDTYYKKVRKKKRSHIRELGERKLGKMYLDDLATLTGGRVITTESTKDGLSTAFKAIADELRHQYSIGYYPIKEGAVGQRKNLKVRVFRPNLRIRARDHYVVKPRK